MVMDHIKNLEIDLQEAACVGDIEVVEELLNKGINVNAKHHLNGCGKEFIAFQGIPYAKPPVGSLRFKSPQPLEKLEDVIDATQEGNICPQINENGYEGSEDCLYLNIYTILDGKEKPVMVWIHGGGYYSGDGNIDMFGPEFIMDSGVVFVSLNYRLAVLGFLSTEDDYAPGNFGLKDQMAALKWIQDNIKYFGGDKNKVTIFGGSAGASSVHFHLLSPASRGLFHRAILQSGSASCSWGFKKNAKETALRLGSKLQCPTENSKRLIKCLREKDVKDVVEAEMSLIDSSLLGRLQFTPVIEKESIEAFIYNDPDSVLSHEMVKNIPVIIGLNNNEGGFFYLALLKYNKQLLKDLQENADTSLPTYLEYDKNLNAKKITQKLKARYFSGNREFHDSLSSLLSDIIFDICVDETARLMSQVSSDVYMYYFTYAGASIASVMFGNTVSDVAHGDELRYIFNVTKYNLPEYSASELEKVKEVVKLWTNFAKFGNPTPESTDLGVKWLPLTENKLNFLEIGTELLSSKNLFNKDKIKFWKEMNNLIYTKQLRDEL